MRTSPPWLIDVTLDPSVRGWLLSALLRRTVKSTNERLRRVTPAVVRASRRRLAKLERPVSLATPRARRERIAVAGMPAERVASPGASTKRTVLMLHGGGYAVGNAALYRALAARVSRATASTVLVPEYRLAPEHTFPAALEDAMAAWDWLAGRHDPRMTAIMGDSAGGGLALALLAQLRDQAEPLPAAAVTIAPWTDLTNSGESLRTNATSDAFLVPRLMSDVAAVYLGAADPTDPRASPLLGRHGGLPPTLIQVSSSEVLHDDAVRFAERAHASGVQVRPERWAGLPHGFQQFAPLLPESEAAIGRIGAFLRGVWEAPEGPGGLRRPPGVTEAS